MQIDPDRLSRPEFRALGVAVVDRFNRLEFTDKERLHAEAGALAIIQQIGSLSDLSKLSAQPADYLAVAQAVAALPIPKSKSEFFDLMERLSAEFSGDA